MRNRPVGARSAEAMLRATVSPAMVVEALMHDFDLSADDARAAVADARSIIIIARRDG